jgi:hypothetical protein
MRKDKWRDMTKPIVVFRKQKPLIFYQQYLCENSDAFAEKVKLLLYPAERKIPLFVRKASTARLHVLLITGNPKDFQ